MDFYQNKGGLSPLTLNHGSFSPTALSPEEPKASSVFLCFLFSSLKTCLSLNCFLNSLKKKKKKKKTTPPKRTSSSLTQKVNIPTWKESSGRRGGAWHRAGPGLTRGEYDTGRGLLRGVAGPVEGRGLTLGGARR